MIYTQEKGDFAATATTWRTDTYFYKTNPMPCGIPPFSNIRILSKNGIYLMVNGSLKRMPREGFELSVSGIGSILPEGFDQVLAVLAASRHEIKNLPVSCIVNEHGLRIEHDEIETDWYRIEGFLETIDYPAFHYYEQT